MIRVSVVRFPDGRVVPVERLTMKTPDGREVAVTEAWAGCGCPPEAGTLPVGAIFIHLTEESGEGA